MGLTLNKVLGIGNNMISKKQSILRLKIRLMVIVGVLLNAVIVYMSINSYYTWAFVATVALQCINLLSIIKLNHRYEWIYGDEI
jgi:membrane protein YdbS with pleckstrin-like domain